MKRSILIYGTIIGAIIIANGIYMVNLIYTNQEFEGNEILGYAAMVVVFSMIFFAIRNYRNKQLNGAISLKEAFKMGALIALVASTVYVVVWLFYFYLAVPDFIEKYTEHVISSANSNGATEAEILAKTEEMNQFDKMYKNPLFVILITYLEILPVGLIVAFVSSLALKKKPKANDSVS